MATEGLFGVVCGYMFANSAKKRDELAQGGNEILGAAYQSQGLGILSSIASRILSQIPYAPLRLGAQVVNGVTPAAGIVLCPAAAVIKKGRYEAGVAYLNSVSTPYISTPASWLPSKLDAARVKLFTAISDNTTALTTGAMLTATVALPFFGMGALAAGLTIPIAFQALESAEMVPTDVSLFLEKYMPTLSNVAMIAGGGPISQLIAVASIGGSIPVVSDYLQKKGEDLVLRFVSIPGPTLDEIDAEWQLNEDLTYQEILYIIENSEPYLYKINPAHCSKQASFDLEIPEDRNFQGFLERIQEIDWEKRYPLLKRAFRDDDRFIAVIRKKFPQSSNIDFEQHLEALAGECNQTKEQFLASKLKEQMQILVEFLTNKRTPTGFLNDMQDAIDLAAQILPYLNKLNIENPLERVELEDLLLKLAIEGGEYCARGIKRAFSEIAFGTVYKDAHNSDPEKSFILSIRQTLQLLRQQIMQSNFQQAVDLMVQFGKEGKVKLTRSDATATDESTAAIVQDIHMMDIFRQYSTLGFYPITQNERDRFTATDTFNWKTQGAIRVGLYEIYKSQLNDAIDIVGELQFANYIREKITSLEQLTEDQKEQLIERLALCAGDDTALDGFKRLFFVMQGVLKVEFNHCTDSGWVEMDENDQEWLFLGDQ